MQEMLCPTSYLKSKGLCKLYLLITDGRFSGGTSGLSIGHVSPEAAEGGTIGLVQEGEKIEIDIPNRRLHLAVSNAELAERRAVVEAKGASAWKPAARARKVSTALKAYAGLTDDERREGRGAGGVRGGSRGPWRLAEVQRPVACASSCASVVLIFLVPVGA